MRGCLPLIGWTFFSLWFGGNLLLYGYEGSATPSMTWKPTTEEVVALGILGIFWLSGIAVWFVLDWLKRVASGESSIDPSMALPFAVVWGSLVALPLIDIGGMLIERIDPYEPHRHWLPLGEIVGIIIFLTSCWIVVWSAGLLVWLLTAHWVWWQLSPTPHAVPRGRPSAPIDAWLASQRRAGTELRETARSPHAEDVIDAETDGNDMDHQH